MRGQGPEWAGRAIEKQNMDSSIGMLLELKTSSRHCNIVECRPVARQRRRKKQQTSMFAHQQLETAIEGNV
jgi:hypothetical protein